MSNLKQKLKTGGIIAVAVIIILALDYGLSWIVTCGIIKLITMCFGLTFKWSIATGIWLIIYILKSVFNIEDLEDQLNKAYRNHDGLLSRVVETLEKRSCIDMANNTSKSQLLTDKDVDKWDEYNQLDEQDRLIKLPCRIGDTVYVKMAPYCKTNYAEAEVKDFVHFISCGFCIVVTSKYFDKQNIPFSEFGKTVFLKKPEAEANLKELEYNLTDKEMEGLQNIVTDTLASKCKNCVFCTWACPGWMCMNKEHPNFDLDDDCPTTVNLDDDGCKLFCLGDNDYKRFLKEK